MNAAGIELISAGTARGYADQVMAYKEEMLANGDILHGCAGLEDVQSFSEWIDFDGRLRAKFGAEYSPSEVFLAIRKDNDKLVGIMDFRHPLSAKLLQYGGSIGYSVRPLERKKGYATEMLRQLLPICRAAGETRVLISCAKDNIASRKVIEANGGHLENEVEDAIGISHSGIIQRFWIELERSGEF